MNINRIAGAIVKVIDSSIIKPNSVAIYDIDRTLLDDNGKPLMSILWTYNYALCKGIKPIIITAREGTNVNIRMTREQLEQNGIRNYKSLYFRPSNERDVTKYKLNARKDVFERGDEALISVGDMEWDIGLYGGFGFKIDYPN